MIRKLIKYTLITVVIFIASAVISIASSIVHYSSKTNIVTSDVAIVLGAGIQGQQPSPIFRERINHGLFLYKTGKVKKLIFTGGVGKGKVMAESEVAKLYAIKQGVAASDIFIERKSKITFENILQAKKLLQKNNLDTVLLVSDPLHMKRAMTMAKDLGVNANTAPTPTSMYRSWSTKLKFLVREVYFYIGYLIRRV